MSLLSFCNLDFVRRSLFSTAHFFLAAHFFFRRSLFFPAPHFSVYVLFSSVPKYLGGELKANWCS